MSKIHYRTLEDACHYIENFNKSEWENMEESEAMPLISKLFNDSLPIDVTSWVRVNEPDKNLIYKDAAIDQVCFMRDIIGGLFFKKYTKRTKVMVIGTHMSKSVLLPVYEIRIPGLTLTIENNFYSFGCSVEADMKVDCDFMGLIDKYKDVEWLYGFPDDRKFKHLASYNNQSFSFETDSKYTFYTIMFLLSQWYFR